MDEEILGRLVWGKSLVHEMIEIAPATGEFMEMYRANKEELHGLGYVVQKRGRKYYVKRWRR